MATRRQPLIPGWLIPGLCAATLVVAVALAAFMALWFNAPQTDIRALVQDSYLWHVLRFSFWQAFLSASLSVFPAIFLARALYRRRFPGRVALLRLCAMTLVLPVLVAVFGILTVYGREGWLAVLCARLGIEWSFSPYGLKGILLAHVFFNLPMATRLLLQALENIPNEQRQVAAQLGMQGWNFFRFVEWPWLRRQILPAAALIFMLCFASFATVLSLGGGPQATTIELAIFQALSYDYDPARAALLAMVQMVCCLGLVLMSQRLSRAISAGVSQMQSWRDPQDNLRRKLCDGLLITLALLLLLPPLLAVIIDGINSGFNSVLSQPVLWQALFTSLRIAVGAGLISVVITVMLLWSSRELRLRNRAFAGQALELSGMLILAMPGIVLATGFFLLLNNTVGLPQSADGIVIFTNALMAIPYALKVLENPMLDVAERYNKLCQSLNITGVNRLRYIELRALKRPLAQALAFACVLSIGDFGVVALFGNEDFRTLPFYLYQQIGSYRSQDGAVTALVLLILCFALFTLIEKLPGRYSQNDSGCRKAASE
ncbi:membrane component of an ABC superfamily thiamine transporter [Buttiauxella ferragutiae ATCC 51602]|uniref:Thiamine transport system permease protein ThiP n=1 Tax=Buttiauxella ferragutiae ATCC 51602 TaxID=1354252 RepID=A0ABX2WBB1_9ENTR|nr:thiamine/thiamine pyrophosphate ABC transporter permease ThiP [Buttiauxella ferragutiae]OAT29294.1 membrane component of an ABC superfamily thiamine transporter [Buttiauxella ferragutiae ATCC 51602]